MGIQDRDWFWEDHDDRKAKYGKNFNGNKHSSRKKHSAPNKAFSSNGNLSDGFKRAFRESKIENLRTRLRAILFFLFSVGFVGGLLYLLFFRPVQ